jgi:hypothetical protein
MKPPPDPYYRHRIPAEVISYAGCTPCSASAREMLKFSWPSGALSSATLVQEVRPDLCHSVAPPRSAARRQVVFV